MVNLEASIAVSAHRAGMFVLLRLLVVTLAVGCNDGSAASNSSCPSGASHACKATTGCVGAQQCQSDGTWSACSCGTALDGGTDLPLLGGACSADSGCPAGATCLLPASTAWLGGGPPVGICVADCSADVAICKASFGNAICVSAVRTGASGVRHSLCMPTCSLSAGTSEDFACSRVPSSACDLLDQGTVGFCRPFCIFDRDCPLGHCDRQMAVCVAEAPPEAAAGFGESCDPAAPSCAGVCLNLSPEPATSTVALCTNRCTYGTYTECATDAASPMAGVCVYAPALAAPGNVGYCTPLCNCNADCKATGFVCEAFALKDTQSVLQHVGMCVPTADANNPVASCGT
jgi:hypothetical protein